MPTISLSDHVRATVLGDGRVALTVDVDGLVMQSLAKAELANAA